MSTPTLWRRRELLPLALFALAPATPLLHAAAPTDIEVWKGPNCTCCVDWFRHLEANGFRVRSHDTGNGDARARLKIPLALGSCHTGLVAGYAIEGHVPAREIRRLLAERPKAVGLAVGGMKLGSPGMDTPVYQGRKEPYDVVLVLADGSSRVYQSYR